MLELFEHRERGATGRGAGRQRRLGNDHALIFLRQEACRQAQEQEGEHDNDARIDCERGVALAEQPSSAE